MSSSLADSRSSCTNPSTRPLPGCLVSHITFNPGHPSLLESGLDLGSHIYQTEYGRGDGV